MGKPGRSRKKQGMGNEAMQRILLISALIFCVLIMGLLIRVLVRGGKQEAATAEEQTVETASDASPVTETVSTRFSGSPIRYRRIRCSGCFSSTRTSVS